jgi:hypothetical protein
MDVINWIRDHPHVIHSPLQNDTIFVFDYATGTKMRKNKLLLQCSIRELHCDLYCPEAGLGEKVLDADTNPIISENMFRTIMPQELRPMTDRYKQMCCCAECVDDEIIKAE